MKQKIKCNFAVNWYLKIQIYLAICIISILFIIGLFNPNFPIICLFLEFSSIIFLFVIINLYNRVIINKNKKIICRKMILGITIKRIKFSDVKIIKNISFGKKSKYIYFITDDIPDEKKIVSTGIKSYIRVLYTDKIFEFIKDSFNDESIFNCNNEK